MLYSMCYKTWYITLLNTFLYNKVLLMLCNIFINIQTWAYNISTCQITCYEENVI